MAQLLPSMRYKGYTFPYNPGTCKYSADRAYVKHKYPELMGAELEDMDPNVAVITGQGELFGADAYNNWQKMVDVFNEHGVGTFYHPIYSNISMALMTKLESNIEPRQDYVSYSFEFVSHDIIPSVKTLIQSTDLNVNSSKSVVDSTNNRTIVVGDTVICNGYAYYNSYGSNPHSAKMTNKTMCVTYVNYSGTHPVHVGSVGWMRLLDVTLGKTTSAPKSTNSYTKYTVKAGDTLAAIGTRYDVSWKSIASLNGIKDPNLIHVGDVLKIPKG